MGGKQSSQINAIQNVWWGNLLDQCRLLTELSAQRQGKWVTVVLAGVVLHVIFDRFHVLHPKEGNIVLLFSIIRTFKKRRELGQYI